MKSVHKKILGFGAVAIAVGIVTFVSAPAQAVPSSVATTDVSTVAPGGNVRVTFTPGANLQDFCNSSLSTTLIPPVTDTDVNTMNDFSIYAVMLHMPAASNEVELSGNHWVGPNLGDPYSGPGLARFNPSTVSSPVVIDLTIPSDYPLGEAFIRLVCVGPNNYYPWLPTASFDQTITIAALPNTGRDETLAATLWGASSLVVAAGVVLFVRARRASRRV
ncbi:LPXTG cell wall anchor domain-containing protein [bacterium]|nr:LPXTG cell wall anchor domain-containing protein [bacterium]